MGQDLSDEIKFLAQSAMAGTKEMDFGNGLVLSDEDHKMFREDPAFRMDILRLVGIMEGVEFESDIDVQAEVEKIKVGLGLSSTNQSSAEMPSAQAGSPDGFASVGNSSEEQGTGISAQILIDAGAEESRTTSSFSTMSSDDGASISSTSYSSNIDTPNEELSADNPESQERLDTLGESLDGLELPMPEGIKSNGEHYDHSDSLSKPAQIEGISEMAVKATEAGVPAR